MSLNAKQVEFTRDVGKLLSYASLSSQPVILAEAYRTAYQAAEYARTGKGIKNSAHCKKLAVDLVRVRDGVVSWARHDYHSWGQYWKNLHPDNRGGGDFKSRDCVHFSRKHGGVC